MFLGEHVVEYGMLHHCPSQKFIVMVEICFVEDYGSEFVYICYTLFLSIIRSDDCFHLVGVYPDLMGISARA